MHYTFTQTSMEALADDLRLMIPRRTPGAPLDLRPVMDRTGIAGHFDFELDVAETDETADNFGALSEALASQLAVKLSRRQGGSRSTGDRPRGTHAHGPLGLG